MTEQAIYISITNPSNIILDLPQPASRIATTTHVTSEFASLIVIVRVFDARVCVFTEYMRQKSVYAIQSGAHETWIFQDAGARPPPDTIHHHHSNGWKYVQLCAPSSSSSSSSGKQRFMHTQTYHTNCFVLHMHVYLCCLRQTHKKTPCSNWLRTKAEFWPMTCAVKYMDGCPFSSAFRIYNHFQLNLYHFTWGGWQQTKSPSHTHTTYTRLLVAHTKAYQI